MSSRPSSESINFFIFKKVASAIKYGYRNYWLKLFQLKYIYFLSELFPKYDFLISVFFAKILHTICNLIN